MMDDLFCEHRTLKIRCPICNRNKREPKKIPEKVDVGVYGKIALKAVEYYTSGEFSNPKSAWEKAASEILKSSSSQNKGCPKSAFLGLCEEGFVKGIPPGDYTKSKKNKEYAIIAVKVLQNEPELMSNIQALWDKVKKLAHYEGGAYNQQMDVVVALFFKNWISLGSCGQYKPIP